MSRFSRKRKSNEENEGPRELKPNQLLAKKWREETEPEVTQISGRVKCIELENFMCHEKLKVEFDLESNNCFYIGGPNGSGKSALFAAMNIGLGGRGNHNDRGNSVKSYIKEGRRTAKIRITLTNSGQSSHPSYGEYAIVERTINQSSSTYVLKSVENGKEIRVSTRKADLDKLMHKYGIQLVNPIFWMSQDRSRHFLQQMKPDKLFEIYMFATELDSTRESYKQLEQAIFDMQRVIARFDKSFNEKKAQIKKIQKHRDQMVSIDKKDYEISVLGWYLLWHPLRDVLAEYEILAKTKEHVLLANSELKERIEANRVERRVLQEHTEQLNKTIGTISEASAAESAAFREADSKRKQVEMEIRGVGENISRLKRDERDDEKQIKDIESEIKKREAALMSNGKVNEKMQLERKAKNIAVEIADIEESVRSSKDELESVKTKAQQKGKEMERIENEKYQSDRLVKDACEDLQKSRAMEKDELAKFGNDIPTIVHTIKRNVAKFEFEPLGPIGQYLEVTEEQWTLAVESAIGKNMASFVLHSQKDRAVFFDLCRQAKVQLPNVIVTNFRTPPHDTRRNEPSNNIPTIERVIKFSNPIIRNALIDTVTIESIMLIDSDDEARDILNGKCPTNVRKGFSRSGGNGTGRNSQGGVYRFYPNQDRDARAKFLTKKKVLIDPVQLNHTIDTEKAKAKELDLSAKKVRQLLDDLGRSKTQLMNRLNQLDTKKSGLESEKRKIDRAMEAMEDADTEDTAIHSLNESIAEIRLNIKKNHEERDGYIKTRGDLERKLVEAKGAVHEAKKRLEDAQNGSGPLEDKLREVRAEIDRHDATHETFLANQRKLKHQLDSFHRQLVELDKRKEKADENLEMRNSPVFKAKFASTGGKPAEFSDPPDFADMPATEETQRTYDNMCLEVNATKQALNSVSYDESKYRLMVEDYNKHSKSLKKLKKICKVLEAEKADRDEKLPVLRHAVSMRLRHAFYKLMSMRNFRGILNVNHKEKIIEITVETEGDRRREKELRGYGTDSDSEEEQEDDEDARKKAAQDLKGLSGGERSYTTACFIMSLWEIMEAPFRCMDEFDVFMDMVNRKVVMELLVKLATEQFAQNQFIFFTPQGIRELGKRDKVQIFEMPKVRD